MGDEKTSSGESAFTVIVAAVANLGIAVAKAVAGQVERACEEAEQQLRERCPSIRRVYPDPTPGIGRRRRAAAR